MTTMAFRQRKRTSFSLDSEMHPEGLVGTRLPPGQQTREGVEENQGAGGALHQASRSETVMPKWNRVRAGRGSYLKRGQKEKEACCGHPDGIAL